MTAQQTLKRGDPRDELIATVAILRADAVRATKLSGLLDFVGSAVDLLPLDSGGADIGARPMLLDSITPEAILAAERDVAEWRRAGYDVRTVLDPEYPSNLQAVYDKPPLVFMQGRWDDAVDGGAVAVVGTRAASEDGCKRAFRLAKHLSSAGITVLSGLAKGIDTCAHRGALQGGGRTVAVMGTGITLRYPAENARLADEILKSGGALLSQFFPAQPPTKWTFPVRNVTMSGLSLATVVVEAGATSGAKMQAEAALTHGRPVFLPTSLVSAHPWARKLVEHGHRGAHAIEVASADEVIERLDPSLAANSPLA
jgi:DNA processing protein